MTTYVQVVTPDVNVPGYSGGCLQYVDDGVNPPNRQPTAQASWKRYFLTLLSVSTMQR